MYDDKAIRSEKLPNKHILDEVEFKPKLQYKPSNRVQAKAHFPQHHKQHGSHVKPFLTKT
jgi:hypothetical protein